MQSTSGSAFPLSGNSWNTWNISKILLAMLCCSEEIGNADSFLQRSSHRQRSRRAWSRCFLLLAATSPTKEVPRRPQNARSASKAFIKSKACEKGLSAPSSCPGSLRQFFLGRASPNYPSIHNPPNPFPDQLINPSNDSLGALARLFGVFVPK